MTKKIAGSNKSSPGDKFFEALKDLLDRLQEGAQEVAGWLSPNSRKPAPQPIPVRNPVYRRAR
jgi:hypothetical protein